MIQITVNSVSVEVAEDATVLQAVRAAGIDLPTLCYHEGLAPYGACRLCMVSLKTPRRELIAACTYPVEEGMVVQTDTRQATATRRMSLEFLLGRCPESEWIQELAAKMGVSTSRFGTASADGKADFCVLCGLCVRVCREAIGANAIGFIGRGERRKVGSPFEVNSDACIGCGACVEICPTAAIHMDDRGNIRSIPNWRTELELCDCSVCGQFYAPQKMAFLKDLFPEIEPFWKLCPACRAQRTARQWIREAYD